MSEDARREEGYVATAPRSPGALARLAVTPTPMADEIAAIIAAVVTAGATPRPGATAASARGRWGLVARPGLPGGTGVDRWQGARSWARARLRV